MQRDESKKTAQVGEGKLGKEQQRLELSEGHPGKGFDFHSAKLLIHRFAFLTFFFPLCLFFNC